MISKTMRVVVACVTWAALSAGALANSAPVVTNVTASQRPDGSKKVDIGYDLADADGDACTVSVQVSSDGGSTWTVPVTVLTGAVGSGITPGTGKLIVWDSKVDLPGAFGSQYKVKVSADDSRNPVPPGMVLIPAGEFQMGNVFNVTIENNPIELPVHKVTLSAFYMDRTEVTNAQYAAALNWAKSQRNLITITRNIVYKYDTGTRYRYCYTTASSPSSRIIWNGRSFGAVPGKENHPIVMVSWYGAVAYANWRSAMAVPPRPLCYDLSTWNCNWNSGYRLPTEAEWEKAARGGVPGHRFPWSDSDTIQHARANYWSSSSLPSDDSPTIGFHPVWGAGDEPYTSPVGFFNGLLRYKADWDWPGGATSYQTTNGANGYGLHDMAGNVFEWCNDWYGSYPADPQTDPHGPISGKSRVLRGDSWHEVAGHCRVAYRVGWTPDGRRGFIGFRLALHPD